jgi:copper chaperone
MEYIIQVENIKCGGCMNSIKTSLLNINDVETVAINKDTASVTVVGLGTLRDALVNKLAQLGYPETGSNNLLHKAKSFVSCAVGRMQTTIDNE